MHGQYSFCLGSYATLDKGFIEIICLNIRLHQHGGEIIVGDGKHGGDISVGRHYYLVMIFHHPKLFIGS